MTINNSDRILSEIRQLKKKNPEKYMQIIELMMSGPDESAKELLTQLWFHVTMQYEEEIENLTEHEKENNGLKFSDKINHYADLYKYGSGVGTADLRYDYNNPNNTWCTVTTDTGSFHKYFDSCSDISRDLKFK